MPHGQPLVLLLLFLVTLPALSGCRGKRPPAPGSGADPAFANAMTQAGVAYQRGVVGEAARLYRRALDRARATDDPAAIGDAAYNLAACLVTLKRYDEASPLLAEAMAEHRRAGRSVADVLLVEAKIARAQGRHGDATEIADRILAERSPPPTASDRARAYVLKGEAAAEAGDATGAAEALNAAVRAAGDRGGGATHPALLGSVSGLRGAVALLDGDHARAAQAFDDEARYCRHAGQYRAMARALGKAAAAHGDAGRRDLAADRYYRAARSTFAQGDAAPALGLAGAALDAAGEARDGELARRAAALRLEISNAAPTTQPTTRDTLQTGQTE